MLINGIVVYQENEIERKFIVRQVDALSENIVCTSKIRTILFLFWREEKDMKILVQGYKEIVFIIVNRR